MAQQKQLGRLSFILSTIVCIFIHGLLAFDPSAPFQHGSDDLSGVRIDTASAIKDFDNGLSIIKANVNVTVRFFGTHLQELKTIRVSRSVQSCEPGDSVGSISADQLIETSPPTAAFNFVFPDYSTTYYFCFEWMHPALYTSPKARADLRPPSFAAVENNDDRNSSSRPPILIERRPVVKRQAPAVFTHQGTARFLSVATAQRFSFFGLG